MKTQLEQAREGHISKEMRSVSQSENINQDEMCEKIARTPNNRVR